MATPGASNTLLDVPGLRAGSAQRVGDGWLSGTTVVLPGPPGAVAGVDVRGGGPGTRETDLLDPRNLVERVHAVVLGGGSALGLAAVDGVVRGLRDDGTGLPMGPGARDVVPIVPAAILFDLGRGGVFDHHPDASLGAEAYRAARDDVAVLNGAVGAGTGARTGGLRGGLGSASTVLPSGHTIGALVALNSVGSCLDPATGTLIGAPWLLPGDLDGLGLDVEPGLDPRALLRTPPADQAAAARRIAEQAAPGAQPPSAPQATTIAVVATDLPLDKARCSRLATSAHDGMARAISPVHTMLDGDTVFALSTAPPGAPAPADDPMALAALFHGVLEQAAHCLTRAIVRAVLASTGVRTPGADLPAHRDVLPGAIAARA